MKKLVMIMLVQFATYNIQAQEQEAEQLLLNVRKLAQMKTILNNMYQGYQKILKGYNGVKDISEGNFNLHQKFLDALSQVSPAVKKYKRVADIISAQSAIVKEYKTNFRTLKVSDLLNDQEMRYISSVHQNLFNQSVQLLDELLLVITSSSLRMDDEERIAAVDRLFDEVTEQLSFLRSFNARAKLLVLNRSKEKTEVITSKIIHAVK